MATYGPVSGVTEFGAPTVILGSVGYGTPRDYPPATPPAQQRGQQNGSGSQQTNGSSAGRYGRGQNGGYGQQQANQSNAGGAGQGGRYDAYGHRH
ncbi:hypothetical protein ACEPPN_001096 [Leptodophora sp. 'Broadleaf-Isolate-01']